MIPFSFVLQSIKWIKPGLPFVVPHLLLIYSSIIFRDFIWKVYTVYDPASAKVNDLICSVGSGLE